MKKLLSLTRSRAACGPIGLAVAMILQGPSSSAQEVNIASQRERVGRLVDEVVTADLELGVVKRRSKILRMKQDVFRVAIADPTIVEFVGFGSREAEIIGKEIGTTTMTLWLGDEDNAQLLSVLVTVTRDDAIEDQGRKDFADLSSLVNEMFPNSRVLLIPVADKVIVRGQARDEQEAVQIMSLIRKNADLLPGGVGGGNVVSGGTAADPFPDSRQATVGRTLINMLKIPGEKQVMLKVRIAELKRSAERDLGANLDLNIKEFMLKSVLTSGANVVASGTFNDGSFNLALKALVRNGSAKILAEPNLVTLSGHPATFLSGGQFAVPTVVGVGGAQAATTTFKGFGTSISFLPTVLDKDRIRLDVQPTFSTLNKDNSVGGVFGLDTRSATTVVDLREGQVLAIAGLLQEQQRGDSRRIPWIGDLPVLNLLTNSRNISRDETELIILVSPELVHPLEPY
ncbi:MAG: type II and III secretion system protein, partial [Planctomycetota bacterium]